MERLLQYLDDLDDFVYAVALTSERIRTLCNLVLSLTLMVAAQSLGIYVAAKNPPLAVAVASLLAVTLLYRSVVAGVRGAKAAA